MLAAAISEATTPQVGLGTISALILFIIGTMWIGALANKAMRKTSFMKGFFLGNRGLGAWALALTATVQSGGTFMGFPSIVYSHGWVVALWISSYMVVPITGFGVLGKRMAHLSRRTGAITIPDLFRARFASPTLGLIASLLILFYMSFMMVAQFKAGAVVMKLAWPGSGNLALSDDSPDFLLTGPRIAGLGKEQVPAAVIEKLQPLESAGFATDRSLRDALALHLSDSELQTYGRTIIEAARQTDWLFLIGLAVFTITVVAYTLLGGFLAAVWTDLFQSVMMLIGVIALVYLSLNQVGGLEQATRMAIENTSSDYAFGPGYDRLGQREFLPIGLAFSFFFVWVFSGMGSPAGMVRIMASKSTATIRRSIYLLATYNLFIYLPLIVICICGRALIPALGDKSDEIIPQMALLTTQGLPGGSFIAGLILAAPFGAVMATVSSYLVVIASGLVRDVYQRFINPEASQHDLRRLSHVVMVLVGAVAVLANLRPVAYLQAIVVFSGTGAAATFCVPAIMLAFWRRATVPGVIASMAAGAGTMLLSYVAGFLLPPDIQPLIGPNTSFRPYFLLGLDPLMWGLAMSLLAGIVVSLLTTPPDAAVISKLFDAEPDIDSAPRSETVHV